MRETTRRRWLRRAALAAAATGFAGCLDRTGSGTETPESSPPAGRADARAPTDPPSPTDRPTATAGPSATPTPDGGTDSPTPDPVTESRTPAAATVWRTDVAGAVSTDPVAEGSWAYVGTEAGVVSRRVVEEGTADWTFEADEPVRDVVQADGLVLVVSGTTELAAGHALHALETASGRRRWSFRPTDWWLEVVAVGEETAFVATADDALGPDGQTLYAVSLADGGRRWAAEIGDPREGTLGDGTVVVSAFGRLYAVDRATGEPLWDRPVNDGVFTTLGAVDGTVVYAFEDPDADAFSVLVGVDAATGAERWRFDDFGVTATAVRDGTVYAGGGGVTAIDPADGSTLWASDDSGFLTDASVTADRVYAGGDALRAHARADGTVDWTWTPDPAQGGVLVAGVAGGSVFVDAYHDAEPRNQYKFLVDAADGDQRWAFEDGTEVTDLAVSASEGVAVAGGANGRLYGLA